MENKTVFPIVSPEVQGNYHYDSKSYQMDHRIQLITVDQYNALKEAGYTVPSYANEGIVLMRHPYLPNTLVDVNYDELQYLQCKFADYAVILNYLGATKQDLQAKIRRHEKREISADGKMKVKGKVSIKGMYKRFTDDKYEVKFTKTIAGTGVRDFERAKAYAIKVGLENDPFVREMLNLREHNPVTDYSCDIIISKDYNDILDAAASLSVMGGAFSMDGDFEKKVSSRNQICICQVLKFEETGK